MKIDFKLIEEKNFPAFKGGNKSLDAKMFFDGKCRIMRGRLEAGASIGMHTHETNCEILMIIKGRGKAICEGTEEILEPGDVSFCEKGQTHTLINESKECLEFFAVVPELN